MNIRYLINNDKCSYHQKDTEKQKNLNFLLTNTKGDFLNLGVLKNSSKFQGFNIFDFSEKQVYKIVDEITVKDYQAFEIEYDLYSITRKLKSTIVEQDDESCASDSFFLGQNSGFVYNIKNFYGILSIDLDCRKSTDFDKWGRIYDVNIENDTILIKYSKNQEYTVYLGIKIPNNNFTLESKWVEKEYSYSKERNSLSNFFVYKLININVESSQKIIFSASLTSIQDVKNQIRILDTYERDLKEFDKNLTDITTKEVDFEKPIPVTLKNSYQLSKNALFNFYKNNTKDSNSSGFTFAGYPWFTETWSRDELISINAFISCDNLSYVKSKLLEYFGKIDFDTGLCKRIEKEDSFLSCDSTLWFAKRFLDLIKYLQKKDELEKHFTKEELDSLYLKFKRIFTSLTEQCFNSETELIQHKKGDSWMDTIDIDYAIDIQVLYLSFIELLSRLSKLLNKREDEKKFCNIESLFEQKIKNSYFSDGILFDSLKKDRFSSNIFLAYYIAPYLFEKEEWEDIFDKALPRLYLKWGGVSSLDIKNKEYQRNYTGENNQSYHNGDSWYWHNCITAMALYKVNEPKYRKTISKIMVSCSEDILEQGTIGYSSELSDSDKFDAKGSLAQLWSSAMFIEMIDIIFKKCN